VSVEQTIKLFMENAEKVSAEIIRASGLDQLDSILESVIGEGSQVYCTGITEIEKGIVFSRSWFKVTDYGKADVCLEEVYAAISETGSLAVSSSTGKPLQAGLLPLHHVAIIRVENVYPKLGDFLGTFKDQFPTNITLETGPSRTADIELTLTIGVHGPERLTIVVV
jgi:L-lactate dehydrogenase complex protein LldG